MAYDELPVTDPLGNKIFLLNELHTEAQPEMEEVLHDVGEVIRKPAFLVSMENGGDKLYYFRSVDWHHTVLLEVHFSHNRWEAFSATLNPPNEVLSDILKKGRKLL